MTKIKCPKCEQLVPKVYYNNGYRVENHNTRDDSDICEGSGLELLKNKGFAPPTYRYKAF